MKYKNILVTGGAGFIGSFLVDALIQQGYSVTIFDNLEEQVHQKNTPKYLNKKARLIHGNVSDYHAFEKALDTIDVVFHLASRVGVGQSNYQITDYTNANVLGMANLLDAIVNKKLPVKKILMTASMTSYGEGDCFCKTCGVVQPALRTEEHMQKKDWRLYCPVCEGVVVSIQTKERQQFNNNSIYSLTKNVQEAMLMLMGKMYNIPAVSLRCFNVYGPRQSLSNPYTGVSAIFISRLKNNHQPVIYEDGMQSRDFISVHDVVDALILSMNSDKANYQVMNMGSGKATPIKDIALLLAKLLHKSIAPKITGEFRKNDIKICTADITKAKELLAWNPKIDLETGFAELIAWSETEESVDLFEQAEEELRKKKLL